MGWVCSKSCMHANHASPNGNAPENGIDSEPLHEGLAGYGGYCDCEVVMNVDADEVFTPVRTPRVSAP